MAIRTAIPSNGRRIPSPRVPASISPRVPTSIRPVGAVAPVITTSARAYPVPVSGRRPVVETIASESNSAIVSPPSTPRTILHGHALQASLQAPVAPTSMPPTPPTVLPLAPASAFVMPSSASSVTSINTSPRTTALPTMSPQLASYVVQSNVVSSSRVNKDAVPAPLSRSIPTQQQVPPTRSYAWPSEDELLECEPLDSPGFREVREKLSALAENTSVAEYDERASPWREMTLLGDIERVYIFWTNPGRFEYESASVLNSLLVHTKVLCNGLATSNTSRSPISINAFPGKTAVWYFLALMGSRNDTHQKAHELAARLEACPGWAQVLVFNEAIRGKVSQVFGRYLHTSQDSWQYSKYWYVDPKVDPRDDWIRHWTDMGIEADSRYDFKSGVWIWEPIKF